MLTYTLWKDDFLYEDMISILIQVALTPVFIIFDLILSPFEIIAFILYKARWHKIEKEFKNGK